MADDKPKHEHHNDDIIIRDQDGTYKILRDGHFVPLDEAEAMEHGLKKSADAGPKRAPDEKAKPIPQFKAEVAATQKAQMPKSQPQKVAMKPMQVASSTEIPGLADQQLREKASEILKKSGVTFASGEQKQRAETILISFVKGVRKPFETKQNLMKSPQNGGAGLEEAETQRILLAAGAKEMPSARPEIDISRTRQPQNDVVKPMMPPVGSEVSTPARIGLDRMPAERQTAAPSRPAMAPKPNVSDVAKPSVPVVGMAGELAYSLADWRRISPNPQDRIKKIENQVGVLEEENFPTKVKGLRAWRESEVMKLYLESGKKSLETGSPLPQLLANGSGDQLSWPEWQAIAELNDRLRG